MMADMLPGITEKLTSEVTLRPPKAFSTLSSTNTGSISTSTLDGSGRQTGFEQLESTGQTSGQEKDHHNHDHSDDKRPVLGLSSYDLPDHKDHRSANERPEKSAYSAKHCHEDDFT